LALLRLRKILLALLAGLLPAVSSEREQRFAFALPEMEGRISLGVFDPRGKLVRTLCVGAAESDFVVGLNGLIATWDGEDDVGKPLPAGKYQVRGYLVGDTLKPEGVAYHFNDWIEDEKSPRITRIEDFGRHPEGFVVLAEVSNTHKPLVFRFDQLRGFVWTKLFDDLPSAGSPGLEEASPASPASPVAKRMLTSTAHYVAVLAGGSLHLLRTEDGMIIKTESESFAHALYMAASEATLLVGASETLASIALPELNLVNEEKTPVEFAALAVYGEHKLAASTSGGEVWETKDQEWKRLPLAAAVSSLSFGVEGTFWVTGRDAEDGKPFTGQFNKEGEFLRAYRVDEFAPVRVCASTAVEEIAVLEMNGSGQRLRVLSLVEENSETPGKWSISFEKTIQDCRRFGIVDGRLVADAGSTPQTDQVSLTLATGGLTQSSDTVAVRVTFDSEGLWLETGSGLRLAFLAGQPNVRRVALLLGPGKDFLTVYAGDDAVVAEYRIRGLGNIVEIDIGEVELP
jgi:hypothetical protein